MIAFGALIRVRWHNDASPSSQHNAQQGVVYQKEDTTRSRPQTIDPDAFPEKRKPYHSQPKNANPQAGLCGAGKHACAMIRNILALS